MTDYSMVLENLLPPLSYEEQNDLLGSLLIDGCLFPIEVTPENVIIDGCQRYRFCITNGIPFEVRTVDVSLDEAKRLRIMRQIARRNLNTYERAALVLAIQDIVKASGPGRTDEKLAEMAGASHDTIHRVRVIKGAPSYVDVQCRTGELSINKGYALARSLEAQDPRVVQLAAMHHITEPETVAILARLKREGRETFGEVALSGMIQPGEEDEAVSITGSPARLQRALDQKARAYARIAVEALILGKTGAVVQDESDLFITFRLDTPLLIGKNRRVTLSIFESEERKGNEPQIVSQSIDEGRSG